MFTVLSKGGAQAEVKQRMENKKKAAAKRAKTVAAKADRLVVKSISQTDINISKPDVANTHKELSDALAKQLPEFTNLHAKERSDENNEKKRVIATVCTPVTAPEQTFECRELTFAYSLRVLSLH